MTVSHARADASEPGPSHLAHIAAIDTLSFPRRFGVVESRHGAQPSAQQVEVAVPAIHGGRQHQAHGARRQQPWRRLRHPWVTSSQGNRMSAYGLTNTARPTSAPAVTGLIVWTASSARQQQGAEQEIGLAEQQFVRVELRHQDDGDPQQRPAATGADRAERRPTSAAEPRAARPRWRTRAPCRYPRRAPRTGAMITANSGKYLNW